MHYLRGSKKTLEVGAKSELGNPFENDIKIALRHSGKEVTEFCSAANVPTLMPIVKMKFDPLERFCPVSKMCICIKKLRDFF